MSIRDYEPILDVLADGIVASDETDRILYVNRAAETLFGWQRPELVGKPLTFLMPPRMHAAHETGFHRYMSSHRPTIMGRPVRVPVQRSDGVEMDVELTLSSIRLSGKEVIVASFRDLRDRVELERHVLAQQRLAAQNAVMSIFVGATSVESVAAAALEAIGRNLGWPLGSLWVVREGRLHWAASWNSPEVDAAAFIARSRELTLSEGEGLPGRAWKERGPVWVTDLQEYRDFPRAGVAVQSKVHAAFAFPVVVGDEVAGVVEFFQDVPQAVDEELLRTAATLGRQIGQGIERIQAQAFQRAATEIADAARVEAQTAAAYARFLAEASAVLSGSLDYEQSLRRVAELAVPRIADWCTIAAVDDAGTLRRIAVVHKDPAKRELAAQFESSFAPAPPRGDSFTSPLKEGQTILRPVVTQADLAPLARSSEHLRVLLELGVSSCVLVPLRIRGEPLGVISLLRSGGAPFGEQEARVAEELAARAVLAIDNARLFRAAQRERASLRFLAEASAVLSSSLDYDQTFQRLTQLVVPRFGDWCGVEVLEEGELRQIAIAYGANQEKMKLARELRERYPSPPDAPAGVSHVLRTGQSELYEDLPDELLVRGARDARHLELLRALNFRSAIIVPLMGLEGPIGVLNLVWSESKRSYTREDVALMEELGRRAGIAVDNARLYRKTQTSLRQRDEFLSIASHELKTPLTSLQLQIGSLRRNLAKPRREALAEEKLVGRVNTIDRQVHRLAQLVENLLDVSRAAEGRLQLESTEFDLAQLVREVTAGFEDDLANANCRLELHLAEGVVGNWDRLRLAQVISNFVSNAVKYGPGAPIEIGVQRSGGKAVLTVRDQGIGIAAVDQQRIFERFTRAVSTEHYSGLGLGLWIVRVLVEAMGGKVFVASAPGAGSTFTVELAALPEKSRG